MKAFIIVIYFICLFLIFIFSLLQIQLAVLYLKNRKNRIRNNKLTSESVETPFVTIQLPVYNEVYVISRLLDCIADLNWPKDKFEIQVLDDSTDETSEIIKRKLSGLNEKKVLTQYIHRTDRNEFKAGALRNGLLTAKGDLIAIFDADFLPPPNFLKNTIPHFKDKNTGAIQTRWGHINRDYSVISRLQAFALDAHFTIEQGGRNSKGYFINFNGTAGVWRKDAIIDSGNWQGDTLVEDLDLSYRAQLRGWKIKYLEDVITPAELPVVFNAVKNQQFRWIKGGTQNMLKNASEVIKAKIPLMTKVNGIFHMLNSFVFIFTFLIALLSYPVFLIQIHFPHYNVVFSIGSVFMLTTFMVMIYYGIAFLSSGRSAWSILLYPVYFFPFLFFIMGLALNNSVAVMEALARKDSAFNRTPKFNIVSRKDKWKQNRYLSYKFNYVNVFEVILALFFLWCIIHSIMLHQSGFLYFFTMLFIGFSFVSVLSIFKITI